MVFGRSRVLTVKKVGHEERPRRALRFAKTSSRVLFTITWLVSHADKPRCLPNASAGRAALLNDQTAWQWFRSNRRGRSVPDKREGCRKMSGLAQSQSRQKPSNRLASILVYRAVLARFR